MPITYEMLRAGRVALFTYPEKFTGGELTATFEAYQRDVLDKTTKKVLTISDFSAVVQLPPNILSTSMTMIRNSHPMNGQMIEVTPNPFVNKLADILRKAFPAGTMIICRTVEQALQEADRLLALETASEKPLE